jgi:hypothetical protein
MHCSALSSAIILVIIIAHTGMGTTIQVPSEQPTIQAGIDAVDQYYEGPAGGGIYSTRGAPRIVDNIIESNSAHSLSHGGGGGEESVVCPIQQSSEEMSSVKTRTIKIIIQVPG